MATKAASTQLNVRADTTFNDDLAIIQRETRIPDRSGATRYAVHREARRIRDRMRRRPK